VLPGEGLKEARHCSEEVLLAIARGSAIRDTMGSMSDAAKRVADICVAAFGLAASIPFWLVIVTAILLEDGWPILYMQPRVGRGGRVFRVCKFRSMIKDAEKYSGAILATEDDPRITRVGRILRKAALDEIPQLINIFKGDMSWVGPRPERPEFVRRFLREIPYYELRYQVRPGLTGVAQVYGRYYTEAAEKLKYDFYYIRNRSLWMDVKLFVRSWLITFKGRWDSSAANR
jgi:lipopolysaccharide/colanic/teichoic acid biosynthesis glycosyltransferase